MRNVGFKLNLNLTQMKAKFQLGNIFPEKVTQKNNAMV